MKHVIDIQDYGGNRVARLLPAFRVRFDENHIHVSRARRRRVLVIIDSFVLDAFGTALLYNTLPKELHCQSRS